MYTDIAKRKMHEFVCEAAQRHGGTVVRQRAHRSVVEFVIADSDIYCVEDYVNQRMGHYAYPWASFVLGENLLGVARQTDEC